MKLNRYTFLALVALLTTVIALPFYATQEQQRLQEAVRELRPSPLDGDSAHEPPPPHY